MDLTRVGAVWEMKGQRPKTMARIGLVVENQESESSLEGYPAKRWLEDRTHSIKPKQRELRTRCS